LSARAGGTIKKRINAIDVGFNRIEFMVTISIQFVADLHAPQRGANLNFRTANNLGVPDFLTRL
jgi:hypothetical protein